MKRFLKTKFFCGSVRFPGAGVDCATLSIGDGRVVKAPEDGVCGSDKAEILKPFALRKWVNCKALRMIGKLLLEGKLGLTPDFSG